MKVFHSNFSNSSDSQLSAKSKLFSSQLFSYSSPDLMECQCTYLHVNIQCRWSGTFGQIFEALFLHSYPFFGSLCHHSFQPPHIPWILISLPRLYEAAVFSLASLFCFVVWYALPGRKPEEYWGSPHLFPSLTHHSPVLPVVQGLKTVVHIFSPSFLVF